MSSQFRIFPVAASTAAHEVDTLTLMLLLACGVMAVLIFVLIVFFGARYRKNSPHGRKIDRSKENHLEWGWTLATILVFMGMFVAGASSFFRMNLAPPGAYEVTVVGKQWMWKFEHPDGHREINSLHVPIDKPVLLTMTSQDVIHSLFVPAFRLKQDVVPGRYVYKWFQATKPGTYHLFCTQYCGTMHSDMVGEVIAMNDVDFQQWLKVGVVPIALASATTRVARGFELFKSRGCASCHGNGATVRAPDLAGLYQSKVLLTDGASVVADDNYLRESILNPRAKIVHGFDAVMPSFSGALNEDEVLDLIHYIRSLKGKRNEE
jgi:cytochrome c oxidase subunit 2